jgi:hypothetical protein
MGNRYIHEICYISGWTCIFTKSPQVLICNISSWTYIQPDAKKTPKCKYVIYPAEPTLLVWMYIIGIHMESAIYPDSS